MAPAISVRDAAPADLAAIHDIYTHHVRTGLGSFEEVAPDIAEMIRRYEAVLTRKLPYLIAEAGGEIGGFTYASPFRSRSAYRYTVEDSVYVAPARLNQGIGTALLTALVARCEALGYRQMVAVIGDSANRASIDLHARLGFVQTGLMPAVGFKFGRWVDTVRMQRALGAGAEIPPDDAAQTG